MRGFHRDSNMETSSPDTRLMRKLTTFETYLKDMYLIMNVNRCVAWSLPIWGITEDLGVLHIELIYLLNISDTR